MLMYIQTFGFFGLVNPQSYCFVYDCKDDECHDTYKGYDGCYAYQPVSYTHLDVYKRQVSMWL